MNSYSTIQEIFSNSKCTIKRTSYDTSVLDGIEANPARIDTDIMEIKVGYERFNKMLAGKIGGCMLN